MLAVAFGKSIMNRIQVQLRYNRFKEGREDVNDDARPDCPSMSTSNENIEAVMKMILDNRQITIRELAADVGIAFGSCQGIFTDVLNMKCAAAKIVTKLLNFKKNILAWTSLRKC